jgi:hypothetical protein
MNAVVFISVTDFINRRILITEMVGGIFSNSIDFYILQVSISVTFCLETKSDQKVQAQ